MSSQLQQRCREMAAAALQAPPKNVWVKAPPPWPVIKMALALLLSTAIFGPLTCFLLYLWWEEGTQGWPLGLGGLFLLYAMAWFVLFWLRLSTMTHAWLRKGFFLRADAQGLEFCLFPFIPWQAVQAIGVDFQDKARFRGQAALAHSDAYSYYQILLTLDEAWLAQNPIPRLWAWKPGLKKKLSEDLYRCTLLLLCSLLGPHTLVIVEELKALRRQHLLRLGQWSPRLTQLLLMQGDPPEEWMRERLQSTQEELRTLLAQNTLDTVQQIQLELYIQQMDDLFTPDGGFWAEFLSHTPFPHLQKLSKEMQRLYELENRSPQQEARMQELAQQLDAGWAEAERSGELKLD